MQKLEDSKEFDRRKTGAIGGSAGSSKSKDKSSVGYSFFHLLLVALLALIAGAFLTQRTQNLLASTFDESAKPNLTEAEVVPEVV